MSKDSVSISLITTCKGRLFYLKESLKSWLKLDYDNYDIIIVDYDDPDGTEEYIKKNRKDLLKNSKAKSIKVVKVKNKPYFNLNDARNRGIDVSDSELIFIIDSDIKINDKKILGKIEKKYIKKNSLFFSNLLILDSSLNEVKKYYKLLYGVNITRFFILPLIIRDIGLSGTSCFIKKIYNNIGKFNEKLSSYGYGCDDIEFYIRYLNYILIEKREIFTNKDKYPYEYFHVFGKNVFSVKNNSEKEKTEFYKSKIKESHNLTAQFIIDFFKKSGKKFSKLIFTESSLFHDSRYNYEKQLGEKLVGFSFYYADELFKNNCFEECKIILEKYYDKYNKKDLILVNYYLSEIYRKNRIEKQSEFLNKSLKAALHIRDKSSNDRYFIGSLYKKSGRYDKALKWFKQVIRESEETELSGKAYFHMGEIFYLKHNYERAEYYLKKVEKLVQNHEKAKLLLNRLNR
jgi:glycosyltransferase involved in cell wall biosynthesis